MVLEMKAKVTYMEMIKEDLVIMRVVPEKGVPNYRTGQFLTMGLPIPAEKKIVRRAYSLASHAGNRDYFEFVIRWVRKPLPGRVTTELFYLSVGDEVLLGYPTGAALQISEKLPNGEKDNRRVICVGGGTGLAPFIAFAHHFHDTNDKRELIILHGASYIDELSYRRLLIGYDDESKKRGSDQWNFKYRAAISRPKEYYNRSWSGPVGRVESFFKPDKKTGLSPVDEMVGEEITPDNTIVYICGYQGTIDGVIEYLGSRDFVTEHEKNPDGSFGIKFESYG
ncbi:MAG: FAD-binding oxidoreductase [Nitrosopumilus sp.]|nr:ferredoxin--NADP reductase [Nitrososphaerota archaeon]MCH9041567.1 ferredoxin--NADP reductase [Nitrososphaerota archaeon]